MTPRRVTGLFLLLAAVLLVAVLAPASAEPVEAQSPSSEVWSADMTAGTIPGFNHYGWTTSGSGTGTLTDTEFVLNAHTYPLSTISRNSNAGSATTVRVVFSTATELPGGDYEFRFGDDALRFADATSFSGSSGISYTWSDVTLPAWGAGALPVSIHDGPDSVPTAPAAPTLSKGVKTVRSLVVEWAVPTSDAETVTGYDVRYRQQGASAWTDGPQNTGATEWQVNYPDLTSGLTYEFQVRSKVDDVGGDWSGSLTVAMDSTTTGGICWRSTATLQDNRGVLGFSRGSHGSISNKHIRCGGLTIEVIEIERDATQPTTFNVKRLGTLAEPGRNSEFTLYTDGAASGNNNWSDFPDDREFTHAPAADWSVGQQVRFHMVEVRRPLAPTVTATTTQSGDRGRLEVGWTPPNNHARPAITRYELRYRMAGEPAWTDSSASLDGDSTALQLQSLQGGVEYQVQVRAVNVDGDGLWSEVASGTSSIGYEADAVWSATMTTGQQFIPGSRGSPGFTRYGYGDLSVSAVGGSLSPATFPGHTVRKLYHSSSSRGDPSLLFELDQRLNGKHVLVFNTAGVTRVVRFDGVHGCASGNFCDVIVSNPGLPQWATGTRVQVGLLRAPTVSVEAVAPSEVYEGGMLRFRVNASRAPLADMPVTLNIAATGDYGVETGNKALVIPAGQTSVTYDAATTYDDVDEANGTVTATLVGHDNYDIAGAPNNTAEATIKDDDLTVGITGNQARLVFSGDTVQLRSQATDAGNAAPSFAWTQTGGPTVALTNANTATASFTAPAVTANTDLTFRLTVTGEGGSVTATAEVTITVGQGFENAIWQGWLTVGSRDINYAVGGSGTRVGFERDSSGGLTDDEFWHAGTTYFVAQMDYHTNRRSSGGQPLDDTGLVVRLSRFLVGNNQCPPNLSGKVVLAFRSGGQTKAVRFNGNSGHCDAPRFQAAFLEYDLTDQHGLSWSGGDRVQVALLPAPTVSVEAHASAVNEGAPARFRVTASRATVASLPVNLNIAATGEFDVTPGNQTFTFPASQSSAVHNVGTTNDGDDEPNGTVTATLVDSDNYDIAASPENTAQVEVRDDDTLSFLVWSATLNPGVSSIGGSIDYTGYRGTGSTFGSLNPTTFTFRGQSYQVSRLAERHEGGSRDIRFDLNRGLGGGTFVLTVGSRSTTFPGGSSGTHVLGGSISSNSGQSVTLRQLQAAPTFNEGESASRSIDESLGAETSGGVAVGSPVSASDVNPTQTLSYSLGGTDGASFTINTANGQISTRAGVNYDYETKSSYSVVVTVIDGSGAGDDRDSIAVTINVVDRAEPPLTPDRPSVAEVVGQADRVTVSWTEPDNTGRPAITGYRLQYKPTAGPAGWMDWTRSGGDLDLSETVTGLMNGVDYSFRVKAVNADGESETWSDVGTGMPWLLITVSIEAVDGRVEEGADPVESVEFKLTATPAPRSTLAVQVDISTSGGDYGISDGRVTVQIATSGTGTYSGTIVDDSVQDDAGLVTATLVDGDAYDLPEDMDDHSATVSITDASDTRGITVTGTSLTVVESGAGNSATYTIRLNTEPTGNVTITPSSNDETVARVSGALTFTPSNWQTDQVVTVTGVDDDVDNSASPRGVRITHEVLGGDYGSNNVVAAPVDVDVTNDDDTRGVTIVADSPIVIDENGGEATFTVVLDSEPTGDVTIALGPIGSAISISEDSPLILTFTPENWDTAQEVTVTGVDDDIDNAGNKRNASILGVAGGGGYGGDGGDVAAVTVPIVTVEITDDDDLGLVVSRDSVSVDEDGGTATYTIKLSSEPTADVTVTPSSDTVSAATVSGALTFTAANWDTAQDVTVTGVDDDIDNPGDKRAATITHSAAGGGYNLSGAASVAVTVVDDEVPVVSIEPVMDSVTEGTPAQFTLTADPAPAAPLTVNLDLAYTAGYVTTFSEGRKTRDIPTSGSLTFDIPTVGDDVDRADGTVTATLAEGTGYELGSSTTAMVTVSDDDERGVTVSETTRTVAENRGTATYTVVLTTQPTDTVTITPRSLDVDTAIVSGTLTFSPTNEANLWSAPQTVTVTAVNDDIDNEVDRATTIRHTARGGDYAGFSIDTVAVTVTDDDTVGVTVSGVTGNALTVNENGNTGNGTAVTYNIKLDSQPTGTVTIALSSNATGNATVSPATLTFDASNWDTNKQVTVTAVNDAIDNEVGGNDYRLATISHVVSGADYGSATISDITVTVTDDDTRGVTISETARTVAEASPGDTTAEYTVRLDSQPTDNVTIMLSSDNAAATVSPASLTFTPGNWQTAKTVTVTGQNDDVDNSDADGTNDHRTATIAHNVANGSSDYNGVTAGSVSVTVNDDDTRGVDITKMGLTVTELTVTEEDGATRTETYVIRLTSEPTSTVTITPNVDAAIATVSPSPLTFNSTNWRDAQQVTVTGVEDSVDNLDDQRVATISHSVAGGDYQGFSAGTVAVTVTDNDTAGVTVSADSLTVSEDGTTTTASYTVSLDTQPRAGQQVVVNVTPISEVNVNKTMLTFTTDNWSTAQTVIVSGVNDNIDNDQDRRTGSITHTVAASSSPEYARLTPAGVGVTVTDDDTREVVVTGGPLTVEEAGGTETYTIELGTEPAATVTVTLGSTGETAAVTLSATTLTFQPTGSTDLWSAPQTVTVTGVNDGIDNRNNRRSASINHTAQGGDYTGQTAGPVTVTVTDDDVPQVKIEASSTPIIEGANAVFNVTATPAPWQQLSVGLSVDIDDDDDPVITRTESVTIQGYVNTPSANAKTVTHNVSTTDDMLYEPAGSITATLTVPSDAAGYELGSPTSAPVTVNDNDNDGPTWGRGLSVVGQTVREDAGQVGVTVRATGLTTDRYSCWADMTDGATTVQATDFSGLGTSLDPDQTIGFKNMATHTVSVTIVNDAVDEDTETLVINCKLAGNTGGTAAGTLTIEDDDTRGITVSPLSVRVTENDPDEDTTNETATYTVVLTSQPSSGTVVVTPTSSDTGSATVSPGTLTFTTGNWNMEQTFTVTSPADDDARHEDATITHDVSAAGNDYAGQSVPAVSVRVIDKDVQGYLELYGDSVAHAERFWLSLPWVDEITATTTQAQMRDYLTNMWDQLQLPNNIETLYPGIDAHNAVLCWSVDGPPGHRWEHGGLNGNGQVISSPGESRRPFSSLGLLAPRVREATVLTFTLSVRKSVSWTEDLKCNPGTELISVEVPVRSTTVGFAEAVGRIPDVLVQPGDSRSFNLIRYFGPAPRALSYSVASVSPSGVANVRLRGSDVIVEALAAGEAVVTLRGSAAARYGGASADQTFRVIAGDDAAITVTYAPDPGVDETLVGLNDNVPGDVFDNTYKVSTPGPLGGSYYRPYKWSWEQLSGPAVRMNVGHYSATFGLPDFPHGTLLKFRVTATQNPEGLARAGLDASSPLTKSHTLVFRVGNPGNTRPLGRPAANAGHDTSASTGTFMSLDGTNSVSPTGSWADLEFRWDVESAPERLLAELRTRIANSYGNEPYIAYFNMPQLYANEALVFRLTVSIWGQSSSDTVRIISNNPLPVADAGPDQEQAPGESVVLRGEGSMGSQVQFVWEQVAGPSVALSNQAARNPVFVLPNDASPGSAFQFQLTVTDSQGRSASDQTTVTAKSPKPQPTARAGPDLTGRPGESVTLQGRGGTNPYGKWWHMAHLWTQLSGTAVTLSDVTVADPTFTVPDDAEDGTTLAFQLTVTDKEGQSDSDTMTVTVRGELVRPTANAGPDLAGEPGESVTLQGKGSTNPYDRWWRMAHLWTQLSGPSVTLSDATVADPTFTLPSDAEAGTTLEFELTVTDEKGRSDSDTMIVTVVVVLEQGGNTPPTFDEGDSAARTLAENTAGGENVGAPLTATDSDDDALTYSLSGADAGSFGINAGSGQLLTKQGVTYDYEAKSTYSVTVEAGDGNGGTASIDVTVDLTDVEEAAPNRAPTFDEGDSAARTLAENTAGGENVGLPLTATDPDEDALTYSLSGADAGSFGINAGSGQLLTKQGATYDYEAKPTYSVTVEANDGNGGTASIAVTASLTDVEEAAPNRAPVFDEGASATRTLTENTAGGGNVGLPFTATDPDDDTLTYTLSGIDANYFEIDAATGQLLTKQGVTYDYEAQASYSVTVTAEDPDGLSASVNVTVSLTDVDEALPVTACFTDLGSLTGAVEFSGAWDDAECRAHHRADSPARYVHFTVSEETTVQISLSAGALYVSKDTPQNGWGTTPGATYEHRVNVRLANGKLLHADGTTVTLTLAAGETYTVEAVGDGDGGTFSLSIAPQ